jgi:hypothetical protein
MLPEENPNTSTTKKYRATLDAIHARNLANRLPVIKHSDPSYNALDPSTGIRIRRQPEGK